MAREGLDAIIAPENTGHYDHWQSDTRYLTQVGGNCVDASAILTMDHDGMAFVGEGSWPGLAAPHWGVRVLPTARYFARAMIPAMHDLKLDHARIGVAGMELGLRAPEGTIKYGTMKKLIDAFPQATFVDATRLMQEARYVKSDEEIAMLERSAAIAEKAVEAMIRTARPGVRECEVYAEMIAAEIREGGELPTMISWFSGPPGARAQRLTMASERVISSPWYITQECEARYAGYVSQRMQPLYIGKLPDGFKAAFEAQNRALFACYEILKPGTTFRQLIETSLRSGEGSGFETPLTMHGRGIGDDAPLITGSAGLAMDMGEVKANCVFQLKPSAVRPGFDGITWADTVVATPNGARRLGKQPIEIANVE